MPETVEKKDKLTPGDLKTLADFMLAELHRRKEARADREKVWAEIDRQIAMTPRVMEVRSGERKDWYPDMESPLQFNALEVIAADARRLKFPRGTEWFSVSAEVSDEYRERWDKRREGNALLSGAGFSFEPDSPAKQLAQAVELDQESANVLAKAVMNHYHLMYDFRSQIDLFDAEQIKYGTGVVRVRPVRMGESVMDFRGRKMKGVIGPAVIPCSIKSTYLDDTPHSVMQEGTMIAPLILREGQQRLDSLLMAAKRGGPERGWIAKQVAQLKPLGQTRHVRIVEGEGDFVVPKSRGSIFLPNFLITIAIGQGDVRVVRMRKNPVPFGSYVPGYYMRHDVTSPYGDSPLTKGQPIQEAVTAVFNDLLSASRFAGDPVVAYDRNDPNFSADGGPVLHPGAVIAADSPNGVEVLKIGDVSGLTTAYLALTKQYEDLTGANDARRGAPVRSHTTTGGVELEASRGIARTDDFVTANEQGPIPSILYMEWEIIKDVMKKTQPVSVGTGGIEGWVNLNEEDLADNLVFRVDGSSGALNEREMASNFLNASNFAVQLKAQAAQTGGNLEVNYAEIANEAYKRAGVNDAARFIGNGEGNAPEAQTGPGVPGAGGEADAEDIIASLVPQQKAGV